MSDDDIDFLLDDEDTTTTTKDQQQQQQQQNSIVDPNSMNMQALSFDAQNGDDQNNNNEESAFAGCLEDEEEEEEEGFDDDDDDDEEDDKNDFHYKKLQQERNTNNETDEGEWTEDDVKVLIAKVEQLRVRFKKVATSLVAHPLIWVPVNGLVANEAKNIFIQQREGSVYFVNGLAKVGHRLDTEIKLLTGNLTSGQFSRAKCNNLAFLEIFVRLLEVEKGIIFISTTLPLRAKKSERTKLAASIDLDLVSRGGLRWIKIRGSSARNMEADVVVDFSSSSSGSDSDDDDDDDDQEQEAGKNQKNKNNGNDDDDKPAKKTNTQSKKNHKNSARADTMTPFTRIVSRISRCCDTDSHSLRLPFGMKPEAFLVCSDTPTARTMNVLDEAAPNVRCIDLINDQAGISLLTPSPARQQQHRKQKKQAANHLPSHQDNSSSSSSSVLDYTIECVNFDVTVMVALCSDITNSDDPQTILHPAIFPSNPVLQRQADAEREGQICIENFLKPILVDFTTIRQKSSSSSSLPPAIQQMIGGTGLELVLSRPEQGDKFWKPLVEKLFEERKSKNNNDDNDDNNADTTGNNEYDFIGLPPRIELENPGSLFGVQSSKNTNTNKNLSFTTIPENWIAAKGAIEEFAWIVETISGPLERERAVWFLHRLRFVDTDAQPGIHDRLRSAFAIGAAAGSTSARTVKQRQLNVFSLGDATSAVTLSANKAFLQTAFECGQLLCCSTHPARALTERKRLGIDTAPDREQWRAGNQPKREKDKF